MLCVCLATRTVPTYVGCLKECRCADTGNYVAGDSDQYQHANKSDNADTTVDGYRYSMGIDH